MHVRPTPRNPAMPRDIYCAAMGTVEPRHAAASNQGKLSVHAWPAICATGVPVRGYWWGGLSSRIEGDCPCSSRELSFLPAPRVSRAPFSRDHQFPTCPRQSIKIVADQYPHGVLELTRLALPEQASRKIPIEIGREK